jgi:hypothetical protein
MWPTRSPKETKRFPGIFPLTCVAWMYFRKRLREIVTQPDTFVIKMYGLFCLGFANFWIAARNANAWKIAFASPAMRREPAQTSDWFAGLSSH